MKRVVFITGLCGAGKSTLASYFKWDYQIYDENFIVEEAQYKSLVKNLRKHRKCIVVEIALTNKYERYKLLKKLKKDVKGVEIIFLCFEKSFWKACFNVFKRLRRDPIAHYKINKYLMRKYSYPRNAIIFPIQI